MDEKIKYTFKKRYDCQMGKIDAGREITQFRNMLFIDGIMIPEPYASDIRRLLSDEKFLKEYIKTEKIIENKV
jgi:hypothetical protein